LRQSLKILLKCQPPFVVKKLAGASYVFSRGNEAETLQAKVPTGAAGKADRG
jgi:hypothetical protein